MRLYEEIISRLSKKYDSLYTAFEDVAFRGSRLTDFGINAAIAKSLTDVIKLRIKPAEVHLSGRLILSSYASDGLDIIKNALMKGEELGGSETKIKYQGGGRYSVNIKSSDYKSAEKTLEAVTRAVIDYVEDHDGQAKFERIES